jgi:FixJ family two-component response regulator
MLEGESTVFIVDDDASVLRSLSRLVRQAGYRSLAFSSATDFLGAHPTPPAHPACMVLDLHLPEINGLELHRKLPSSHGHCPVIFISGDGDIPSTVAAMKQGAVTFLSKPFEPDALLDSIAEALEIHRAQLDADTRRLAVARCVGELTAREREVMSWVITGALNKQIASHMGIGEKTVKVHRARVMEKMQVSSVAELVRACDAADFSAANS